MCISVSDTGVGMTKSQKRRLGEPYFSTKDSGTGLGLLISYRIIEAMNGKVSVTSSPGHGSEFRITFPTAD
ncbi:ATP-binding protein [Rossellomorea marisflavi]|uniref:ATP-binding protein n=1 Tax=Rossellomorea marisflavi TaxID=189381 RepID=UPI00201DAFA9|nr:HAMP domain-containing sensor histidine kinase [Rossellomorea marisflavi]